jgi:hypothetical protein
VKAIWIVSHVLWVRIRIPLGSFDLTVLVMMLALKMIEKFILSSYFDC